MVVRELLAWAREQLCNSESAATDAIALLVHASGYTSASLYAKHEEVLGPMLAKKFRDTIEQRKVGVPVAYITGHRAFWNLDLKITPHVLIPRHETELVVERVVKISERTLIHSVLDLGTGSGAIALAIAKEMPHSRVMGVDICEGAIALAEANKNCLNISNVEFVVSDWYTAVGKSGFDMIVSNPPYVAVNDPHLEQGDVRHEPRRALVSADGGYADLHYLIGMSRRFLHPGGWIVLEHGFEQGEQVREMLGSADFSDVSTHRDLSGNERVSEGRLSPALLPDSLA